MNEGIGCHQNVIGNSNAVVYGPGIAKVVNRLVVTSDHYRKILLTRVRRKWIDAVPELSLCNNSHITLEFHDRPDAVARNSQHLGTEKMKQLVCSSDVRITDIYDQVEDSLLILGAPGSGKTTQLLELTRYLLGQ